MARTTRPEFQRNTGARSEKTTAVLAVDDQAWPQSSLAGGVSVSQQTEAATPQCVGTRPRGSYFAVSAIVAFSILLWLFTGSSGILFCFHHRWATSGGFSSARGPLVPRLSARAALSSVLEVFQIFPPVLTVTPEGVLKITDGSSNASVSVIDSKNPTCQETLVVHSFAYSYGIPYVGQYSPPNCTFNRVTWNLTVTSRGRQFDRLGIVYLGDVEVFRTSTAEPTTNGVEWTYLKDMTNYLPLFQEDQKVIFDLGNLINDIYTAPFNVTVTAAFFTADDSITAADLILPVSSRKSSMNMPSVFTVPSDTASNNLTLPRNVRKAVFTLSATGQSAEEFWWSNVLQSETATFPSYGDLYGYSPFREVQLFIDGELAGVAWPFPIIFTGGIVPGLWRPIVGIDAFDLREDEIDITPWLPVLCDGKAHNFTIRVSGLYDSGNGTATLSETTGSYWLVTGKVFIWLDAEGHVTTGSGPTKVTSAPTFSVSSTIEQSASGANETLLYQVHAKRSLYFHSKLNLSNGSTIATWAQDLSYSNSGNFSDQGNIEINDQQTTGYDVSSSGYARHISYPLFVYSVYETYKDNISYFANVNRGKDVKTLGEPVFPTGRESFSSASPIHALYSHFQGAHLATTQNGSATYLANQTSSTSYSYGTTEQDLTFSGIMSSGDRELFHRYAQAVNGTVVEDQETLVGQTVRNPYHGPLGSSQDFLLAGVPGHGGRWRGKYAAVTEDL